MYSISTQSVNASQINIWLLKCMSSKKKTRGHAYLFAIFNHNCRSNVSAWCMMNSSYTFHNDVDCQPAFLDNPFRTIFSSKLKSQVQERNWFNLTFSKLNLNFLLYSKWIPAKYIHFSCPDLKWGQGVPPPCKIQMSYYLHYKTTKNKPQTPSGKLY